MYLAFVDQFRGGFLVETALLTLFFLSALLAIGGRLRTLVGAVLIAPALVGEWLNYWRSDLPGSVSQNSLGILARQSNFELPARPGKECFEPLIVEKHAHSLASTHVL